MNENVHWVLEVTIKAGERENFEAVMNDMVEATQANEPGTMNYEWFISEDGTRCHLYERYRDSAATMIHIATFGEKFAGRFLGCVEPTRIVVYGNPSEEVRGALVAFGAIHMEQVAGFAR